MHFLCSRLIFLVSSNFLLQQISLARSFPDAHFNITQSSIFNSNKKIPQEVAGRGSWLSSVVSFYDSVEALIFFFLEDLVFYTLFLRVLIICLDGNVFKGTIRSFESSILD